MTHTDTHTDIDTDTQTDSEVTDEGYTEIASRLRSPDTVERVSQLHSTVQQHQLIMLNI